MYYIIDNELQWTAHTDHCICWSALEYSTGCKISYLGLHACSTIFILHLSIHTFCTEEKSMLTRVGPIIY